MIRLLSRVPDTSWLAAELALEAPPRPDGEHVPTARDFHRWGQDRYLLAAVYDALNTNTAVTGRWKSRPPKFDPWPRPQAQAASPVVPIDQTPAENWPPLPPEEVRA